MQHTSSRLVTGSDVHGSEAFFHWFSCSWWCSFSKICWPRVKTFSPAHDAQLLQFYVSPLLEPEMYRVMSKSALSCRCWGRELKSMKWMPTDVRFEGFFAYFAETFGFDPQKTWTRACSAFPVITVTLDHKSRISRPPVLCLYGTADECSEGEQQIPHMDRQKDGKAEVLLCKQTDVGGHQTVDQTISLHSDPHLLTSRSK